MGCVVAREIWVHCFALARIQVDVPDNMENLDTWWLKACKRYRKKAKQQFNVFVILVYGEECLYVQQDFEAMFSVGVGGPDLG
jgi:hypothetical protein